MLRIEEIIHPDGTPIDTLWWLYPKGNKGMFIFHSHGITINFTRFENQYFYTMRLGTAIVAASTQAISNPIIAVLDPGYYTFVHHIARNVQKIWN